MTMRILLGALVGAAMATAPLHAGERLPITLVSSSSAFDRACPNYYRQGNDEDVAAEIGPAFCTCIAGGIEAQGLGTEVLDFLGRTYSEDLTAFIGEYPKGEAWMEAYFATEAQCKQADYGSNEPAQEEPNPPPGPIEAGSWGGIVRDGPGQEYRRVATLEERERVLLKENTSVMFNGFPWWVIEYRGGKEGYQWGGILCSLDGEMEGVFGECE